MRTAPHLTIVLACSCASAPTPVGSETPPVEDEAAVLLEVDGAPMPIAEAYVVSRQNDNQLFGLHLRLDLEPDEAGPRQVELTVGEQSYGAPGIGFDGELATCQFEATPSQAAALASALDVPLQSRAHPGHQLSAQFDLIDPTAVEPDSVTARFVLANTGDVAIEYFDGGRSRNEVGRDNRFTFTIERDGEAIEPRTIYDFGGLAGIRALGPGESQAIEVDLTHWCPFDRPGTYELRAEFELSVQPAGTWPRKGAWLPSAHLTWDETVYAVAQVEVRNP